MGGISGSTLARVGHEGDQRQRRFGTSGSLIRSYAPDPLVVRPLGTVEAFVPVEDTRGGSGANFIVEWAGEGPTTEPLIEAVMIGSSGTQGYSFVSRGKAANVLQPAR